MGNLTWPLPVLALNGMIGITDPTPEIQYVGGDTGDRSDYKHTGSPNILYDAYKFVLDALYAGLIAVSDLLNTMSIFGGALWWEFPSGLCIKTWERGTGVLDFRPKNKNFAFLFLDLGVFYKGLIPFDDPTLTELGNGWRNVTKDEGSADWWYREGFLRGAIKQGKDYNPVRTYSYGYDLIKDVGVYTIIIIIIYIFHKLGLDDAVVALIKWIFTNNRYKQQLNAARDADNTAKEVAAAVEQLETNLNSLSNSVENGLINISTVAQSSHDEIEQIKNIIGLRLSL